MKQITLVTGAGRGIGFAIAEKFARAEHELILLVQDKNQINFLKKKLDKISGSKKIYFYGDLRDVKFLSMLDKKVKKINNLINNAAQANTDYFTNVSDSQINNLIEVNLKAPFKLSQIFAKKMIKNKIKGCIVNITSQLGHMAAYNRSLYCMTKFGLEGLSKAMAMDLAKHGIRSNTVAPTKTIVNQIERKKTVKRLNIIRNKIPLKKFSTTKQIAEIVYFLTTDNSLSITGTSIVSDGGWTAGK
jgi:NAD(P)-dependent dehydrogenase (short-subunit alcohol dehydrogenase family)